MTNKVLKRARKKLGLDGKALFKPASLGTILKGYLGIENVKELDDLLTTNPISKKRLKKIITEKDPITTIEAIKLAEHYHTSVQFWINLDISYQVHKRYTN